MATALRPAAARSVAGVVLCLLMTTALACGRARSAASGDATAEPPGFTDELGRSVRPRALPTRRLVSLAPNVTELLFAIGAGGQLVGVDTYSDEPADGVAGLRRVGSDYEPSLETIVGLAPDLVLSSFSANRRETVEALERLGLPTFVTDSRSVADVERLLRSLGRLTGHVPEAERHIARTEAGLLALRQRLAGESRPRVLVVVWTEPLYVAGRHTFVDDLVAAAGAENIGGDAVGFVRYSLEKVLASGPEVIVIPTHAPNAAGPSETLAFWSRWPSLPAVARHRIHALPDSLVVRPGARLLRAAETLAALFHPDLPPPPP